MAYGTGGRTSVWMPKSSRALGRRGLLHGVSDRADARRARFATVGGWARRALGTITHERRVRSIARSLFELTEPFHALNASWLELLELASLVHDVGRSMDEKTHPAQGARMLLEDATLPLSPRERRLIAFLTRYHRGDIPLSGEEKILDAGDDRRPIRCLLALLRAADALDSRSLESPRLVLWARGRRICVTCYLRHDCPKARRVYQRRKKFRLLEEELDCRIEVDLRLGEAVRVVG